MEFPGLWSTAKRSAAPYIVMFLIPYLQAQEPTPAPSLPQAQSAPASASMFGVKEYLKPKSHFPNPLAAYTPRHIAPPGMANTARLDQLLRDGKLYISINDAIALALENNLDVDIARVNLKIADTDVWRADAGSAISGVDSGVVQNTPGGGVGGLDSKVGSGQGGTSVGAGGAGAGVGGIVGSTLGSGPAVSSFDPTLTGSIQVEHAKSECNTPFCATNQDTTTANFSYTQGFHWGGDMTVAFNNNRVASNSVYDFLTPSLNSSFQFRLDQHLLQGFGLFTNTRYIQIARNNRQISDVAFRDQIVTTVDQIENMYWDLVYAYETLKVQSKQMEFAQKTLSNNRKQMEIGSLAPIEVVRAQSTVATNQQSLTLAQTNLELVQLLMKNAISRSLDDPVLAEAEVIPTSTIDLPAQEPVVPTQELIDQAFKHRPDLEEALINRINTQISNKAIRNALLPSLDLSAFYGGTGLGGSQNPAYVCLSNPQTCGLNAPPPSLPPVSYGSTLSQLVNSSASDKGVSVSLTIPIRNRAAQATQVRSELENQQAQMRIQQLENQIRIEVRNAQFGVRENRASVDAAQAAVDLARQALQSEQKKLEIRASTPVLVLQNQVALTQAEATLISAKVAYEKAVVELDRAVGLLLDHAGILIADAERGQMTRTPSVPNVPLPAAGQPTAPNQPGPGRQ